MTGRPRDTAEPSTTERPSVITVTIECPGYHSRVELPVDAPDKAAVFTDWFKMQLDYLARWKPGSEASIRERVPLKS